MADFEERLRGLEHKFWLATGAGLFLAAWFGVTSFYLIPNAADDALQKRLEGQAGEKIKKLLADAEKNSAQVAKLSAGGTITIGGKCFKPTLAFHCISTSGGHTQRLTWFGEGGCGVGEFNFEGSKTFVLAECS